jgi:hypothetical protein
MYSQKIQVGDGTGGKNLPTCIIHVRRLLIAFRKNLIPYAKAGVFTSAGHVINRYLRYSDMDHRHLMFPFPPPYYHSARRSSWYQSLRIEPMDSPGVVTNGRVLKGTGWQSGMGSAAH